MASQGSEPASVREVKYLRIANELQADIQAGVLAPGDKIPSTHELADRYDVTPATVQSAVALLKSQRFVEGRQGAGTFVLPKVIWSAGHSVNGGSFYVDPAMTPSHVFEDEHSLTAELGTFHEYQELAERDDEFWVRFMRQLRRFNKLMAMEREYWQLRQGR